MSYFETYPITRYVGNCKNQSILERIYIKKKTNHCGILRPLEYKLNSYHTHVVSKENVHALLTWVLSSDKILYPCSKLKRN